MSLLISLFLPGLQAQENSAMPRFTEFRTPEEFDSGGWQNKIIDEAQIDSRILQLVTSKDTVDYYNRWICVQVLDKTTRRLLQEIDLAADEEGGVGDMLCVDDYNFDGYDDFSMLDALCSQRSQNCLPNVGWCEVTDMLFKNNAKIGEKYFPDTLGVLKPGAAADIIVMDYKPFTPFSDENIDGHMIFGMTGRQCQTTIAAGKTLMLDRELVGIDEEAENAHILEAAKKLWGDLNHRKY